MNFRIATSVLKTNSSIGSSRILSSISGANSLTPLVSTSFAKNKLSFNYQSRMNLLTISNSIKESYIKHGIIPDVIADKNFDPKGLLIISYGKDKEVTLGNTLAVDETQSLPKIAFTLNVSDKNGFEVDTNDAFTLVLTDPDAPSRTEKKWSDFCHYVVSDLKLNPISTSEVGDNVKNLTTDLEFDKGTTLIPYKGPGPPPGTGKHRYVFLFYKQKKGVSPKPPSDRPNWGTGIPAFPAEKWAAKYDLELLSANFFLAQNKEQ
ncbi:hypothetical protein PACTADRAFT_50510 [Pachysolen tannophilus NRRL Y-2460]|uniref:Phosphatidylethanolamine-binding protein n=1 Tax=Pachysolen tannophilus NRRL Y-2460 TaxID=669874 RepID=A0A1E4TSE0_PACTA|nr:hypothetical protein PACTADRAFT_50510 [Pachysolen tannophilus NRRL Y-2460]